MRYHRHAKTHFGRILTYMRQPSVFNGPEITMPKDNIHHGGWEHRDIHNINGMLFVCPIPVSLGLHLDNLGVPQSKATYQALMARSDPPKRPFVLTRSFYAGSQRFGAMWTGDNLGTWEHMAVGVPMVLANGISGMTFSGGESLLSIFLHTIATRLCSRRRWFLWQSGTGFVGSVVSSRSLCAFLPRTCTH
jgi:hypothetical protein